MEVIFEEVLGRPFASYNRTPAPILPRAVFVRRLLLVELMNQVSPELKDLPDAPELADLRELAVVTAFEERGSRDPLHWSVSLVFTVGAHLALLGALSETPWWGVGRAVTGREPDSLLVYLPDDESDPLEFLQPQVVLAPTKPEPKRLSRRRTPGGPDAERVPTTGRLERRRHSAEPTMANIAEVANVPRQRAAVVPVDPSVGLASEAAGAGGELVSARASDGEQTAECIVFVVDNSSDNTSAAALHKELLARLGQLDPLQYFYVIAYDRAAHRMFSEHSPELRPLPPTRYNLWLVARWLRGLPQPSPELQAAPDDATGARWAVVHALQLRPAAVYVLGSGGWHESATGYLRSTNLGPNREVIVPVHAVVTKRSLATRLTTVARENRGTLEVLQPASR
ncbi:MAG: hypothetical protein KDB14_31310 [Planctomycetales bacterium]|nr:hypothetical protein [Planctomycetales bacterium]